MMNFKELFQKKNEDKIISAFQYKLNNISDEEIYKIINFVDYDGNSLLHHAYNNKCIKLAQFFYNKKIGRNIINNNGSVIESSINEVNNEDANSIFSDINNNINYNSTQSETEMQNNQVGGFNIDNKNLLKTNNIENSNNSINNIIKYTKNKKNKYVQDGQKLIKYIKNISNNSKNINNIAKLYKLNLDKPNDILLAKYKQTGLYDYISNKYPKLINDDINKLIDFNCNKDILDKIDHIRTKNKIMKCFKNLS